VGMVVGATDAGTVVGEKGITAGTLHALKISAVSTGTRIDQRVR